MVERNRFKLVKDVVHLFRYGFMEVLIYKNRRELFIKSKTAENYYNSQTDLNLQTQFTLDEITELPDLLDDWEREIIKEETAFVDFVPILPDRPIVLKSKTELSISPDTEAEFIINLPIAFDIFVNDKKSSAISSATLTNTWFGDTANGQLCYGKKSSFKLFDHSKIQDYMMAYNFNCPVIVKNNSNQTFKFVRLCLPTEYLSIFELKGFYWTSKAVFLVDGDNQSTQIEFSDGMYENKSLDVVKVHEAKSYDHKKNYKHFFANLLSR